MRTFSKKLCLIYIQSNTEVNSVHKYSQSGKLEPEKQEFTSQHDYEFQPKRISPVEITFFQAQIISYAKK